LTLTVLNSLQALGAAFVRKGKLAAAEPMLERSLSMAQMIHGPTSAEAESTKEQLGDLYEDLGKFDEKDRHKTCISYEQIHHETYTRTFFHAQTLNAQRCPDH